MGRVLRGKRHIAVAFLALLATIVAAPVEAGKKRTRATTAAELALLQEMNRSRAAHGLPALRLDLSLQRAARAHSMAMLRHQVFSHGSFIARLRKYGVRGNNVAENLAWGTGSSSTAAAIVQMWLDSPPHRANLLGPRLTRVGVGSLVGTFSGYRGARVVTADFAG